jgi:3-methylcrotonyl-CoA carboxylase alpha subunit
MFGKLLVANRGEIAVRVMQTCAELGIRTVAVYSEADSRALHVRRADESYCIGPAPAAASYLNIDAIIAVARECGAQAIHPGYGFLAENPAFADACQAAGLVFVGPPAAVMRLLGNKAAAKALARRAGVPVIPGDDGEQQADDALAGAARRLGYPLLIKAVAGGGGRGMRLVRSADEFPAALESARREAQAAFGDADVLLERLIEAPRHIEVQVLADAHGSVVHLGERECSIQRRHQKIIEEAPSAALTPPRRAAIGQAAVAVMRAAGYVNAGTVEFLLAPSGEYHFLEVNTRLQVEHPVTEAITGLDLVREQVRISAGLPLTLAQEEVRVTGHAIQCRVYAEDPAAGFLPATGSLLAFQPPVGVGIRNDVGVTTGETVGPHYDPLLAKLTVHAPDRSTCLARARRALDAYTVLGVTTNLPLLRAVLAAPAFQRADLATDFLARHQPALAVTADLPTPVLLAAAIWQVTDAPAPTSDPWRGAWRLAGQGILLRYQHGDQVHTVTVSREGGDAWRVITAAGEQVVRAERLGPATLLLRQGARVWEAHVVEADGALHLGIGGEAFRLTLARGLDGDIGAGPSTAGDRLDAVRAPLPGVVVKIGVQEGERVDAGQPLIVLEAMKMEHHVTAPHGGTVRRLACTVGQQVQAGLVLAEVEP